jgi:hypothetical protein
MVRAQGAKASVATQADAASRRLITVKAELRREDDVLIASAQQVRLEKENG